MRGPVDLEARGTEGVGAATFQVLASASLSKVKNFLSETCAFVEARAVCTNNPPTVPSISTLEPQQHPGVATTFEHLKPDSMCPSTKMLDALAIAPSMQAIIVNGIPVVDPQFASIIGDDAKAVVTVPADSQSACPTDGKVIAPDKALPFAIRVAIVHYLVGPMFER